MSAESLESVFSAAENPALKLSNVAGHVVISGAPVSEIQVRARKRDDGDLENTLVLIRQLEDGCVEVKVEPKQAALGWLLSPRLCSVDMDVQVPHQTKVTASVVSAGLEISAVQGNLQATAVSGDMDLSELSGALSISTVSGQVDGSGLNGDLHLNTVSGEIALDRSDLSSLNLSTVSGDIRLKSAIHAAGQYRLSTVSGSIDWQVPEGTSCVVRSSSISGEVLVHTSGARQHFRAGKQRALTIGEGGPEVKLSSISGDLRIHASLPVPQVT